MCDECGCGDVKVDRSVNEVNDNVAHDNWHLLKDKEVLCVNIMGSPGSGKTSVIEGIAGFMKHLSVIQGDLESDVDKRRLEKINIPTFQINTHSGCHLTAQMIADALVNMSLKNYLLIENVGNLVCPAGVKLGQHVNLLVCSTAEGSDKPKKYPHIFMDADMIIISKMDIADAVGFDEASFVADIKTINQKARIITVTTKDKASFEPIYSFLEHRREHLIEHEHRH